MADDAEDVLELDTGADLDTEDDPQAEDQQTDGEPEDDGGEDLITFAGEEAAPASGDESSVIRELRRANRELAKRNAQLERGSTPQRIEVGEKPTLASCDYDEERFETELDQWKATKAKADKADAEAEERQQAEAKEWVNRAEAYKADKATLKVSDYADAEETVFAALSEPHQALLMMTGKPAALIYALAKSPAKLAELEKLDLARAAMMIGKLEDKLHMERKPAAPERRLSGNAGFSGGSSDKQLARLKAKAEQTGDYSEYFAAKRAAQA